MCNVDLVAIVLSHAEVCPRRFAHWRRVSTVWREACGLNEALLMQAARSPKYLTKGAFMGLFGLTSAEADAFERVVCMSRKGLMYKYSADAVDAALPAISGFEWWAERISRRASEKLIAKRQRLS